MSFSAPSVRRALAPTLALVLACLAAPTASQAQIVGPVSWNFTSRKLGANLYELHLNATIDGGWRLYSQNPGGAGPVPTSVRISRNSGVAQQGPVKEVGRLRKIADPAFGSSVAVYNNSVDFVVTVRKAGNAPATVGGAIEYMVADDHQVQPPTSRDFRIKLD